MKKKLLFLLLILSLSNGILFLSLSFSKTTAPEKKVKLVLADSILVTVPEKTFLVDYLSDLRIYNDTVYLLNHQNGNIIHYSLNAEYINTFIPNVPKKKYFTDKPPKIIIE